MNKRSVLITGATGYFGRYLVEHLKGQYRVIAASRSLEKLERMFPGESISKVTLDLYAPERFAETVNELSRTHDIHGLINNAYDFSQKTGFNTPDGRIENISIGAMRAGMESGLLAPMVLAQAVGNEMIRKGIRGSIINISSMYGSVAPDYRLYEGKSAMNPVTYGVAKAGLNALTRYLASFWGPNGIRCNSICPGTFPNVETNSPNAPKDDEFTERLKRKTTLGRLGHPRDLLGVVDLLLSEESTYLTGQQIGVDGGWTVT